jgi:hypothetical protein
MWEHIPIANNGEAPIGTWGCADSDTVCDRNDIAYTQDLFAGIAAWGVCE